MINNQYDLNKTRYTHRDYESIKEDLINAIPSLTQEWTDRGDSDPGIVLIKLMSMFGDTLSYNVDKIALELYIQTVTQRKNCSKILELLGYKMHWYRSAKVVAHVRLKSGTDGLGNPIHVLLRPYETTFSADDLIYTVVPSGLGMDDIDISSSTYAEPVNLVQGYPQTETFTSSSLTNNRYYINTINIDESTMRMTVTSSRHIACTLVDNLYLNTGSSQIFYEFNVDEYSRPYIQLAENWQDILDSDSAATFTLTYLVSAGSRGNVSSNAFNGISNVASVTGSSNFYNLIITNLPNNTEYEDGQTVDAYNAPGQDPQTVEDAKKDSANYTFTYDTLVTSSDYEKAAKRINNITVSKMVDGQVILNDNLDAAGVVLRCKDNFGSGSDLAPYLVILYLGYRNFEPSYNKYYMDSAWADTYSLAGETDPYSSDYAGHTDLVNLGYYPYMITNNIQQSVRELMDKLHTLTVEVEFGTLKLFPFKVTGTLHLISPLAPQETLQILDNVNSALEEQFYPDTRPAGEKPNFIELVNIIQGADERIKYFDAVGNIVEWAPLVNTTTPSGSNYIDKVFDTTSAIMYNGLSSSFTVDPKYLRFTYKNLGVTLDSEDQADLILTPVLDEHGTVIGESPASEGQNVNVPEDYGTAYLINLSQLRAGHPITDPNSNELIKIDVGTTALIELNSTAELEALCKDVVYKDLWIYDAGQGLSIKVNNTGLQYMGA